MNENPIAVIPDAYHIEGALLQEGGWYAAALILPDVDADFIEDDPDGRDRQRRLLPGKCLDDWAAACLAEPARIALVSASDPNNAVELAMGLQLYPPVVPREPVPSPVVAWSECRAGEYAVRLWRGGGARRIATSRAAFGPLSVCAADDFVRVAYQTVLGQGEPAVCICDEGGTVLAQIEGRNPQLRAMGDRLLLLHEECEGSSARLYVSCLAIDGCILSTTIVPALEAMNTHPDLVVESASAARVVWESSPAWGAEHYIASHRSLLTVSISVAGDTMTCGAPQIVPIPTQAHATAAERRPPMNLPPVFPRWVRLPSGPPAVAFRRFRPDRPRAFGWDVYLSVPGAAGGWAPARRVSPNYGAADAGYAILAAGQALIGLFPCCTNRGGSVRIGEIRAEIRRFAADTDLGDVPITDRRDGVYAVQPAEPDLCPSPPPLPDGPRDLDLLWGDLHRHSFMSKCMCARDGSPEEGVRYCRDVLGADVITITDHHHHMGFPEAQWLALQLEREAAGQILIYGTEPGCAPGHHTNFYALDRETWERARCVALLNNERTVFHAAIRDHMPPRTMWPVRHIHGSRQGRENIYSDETVATFAPDLEVAMETLQTRGCYLLDGDFECAHPFPNAFLDAGAQVALLGGTDHTGQPSVNRFGLTGIWAAGRSPDAVWQAVRERRTVASANGKMALWATCRGTPFGSVLEHDGGALEINVQVSAARSLRRIGLFENGVCHKWVELDGTTWEGQVRSSQTSGPGQHWIVVGVQAESAYTEGRGFDPDDSRIPWNWAFASPFYVVLVSQYIPAPAATTPVNTARPTRSTRQA